MNLRSLRKQVRAIERALPPLPPGADASAAPVPPELAAWGQDMLGKAAEHWCARVLTGAPTAVEHLSVLDLIGVAASYLDGVPPALGEEVAARLDRWFPTGHALRPFLLGLEAELRRQLRQVHDQLSAGGMSDLEMAMISPDPADRLHPTGETP